MADLEKERDSLSSELQRLRYGTRHTHLPLQADRLDYLVYVSFVHYMLSRLVQGKCVNCISGWLLEVAL